MARRMRREAHREEGAFFLPPGIPAETAAGLLQAAVQMYCCLQVKTYSTVTDLARLRG